MKTTLDKETLGKARKFPALPDLLDRIPWTAFDAAAFAAFAAFGLWPVVVLIPTLAHGSFDRMVDWNMAAMDKFFFPLIAWASIAVYVLALAKALREKRPLFRTFLRNPTMLIFLALVVWMIVNIPLTNGVTRILVYGVGLKHESFPLHLEYFLCFLPLGLFLRNPRLKLWLLRGMCVVSVILSSTAFYLYGHLQASSYYYDWRPVYASIFTNINYYGYFLTVFISLSAALFTCEESRGWRCFYAVSIILNTTILVYNNTFGAWIGAFCGCLFIVAARRVLDGKFTRRPLTALALFVAALCLVGLFKGSLLLNVQRLSTDVGLTLTQPDSPQAARAGSGRWYIWGKCMELIFRFPLTGIGFEGIHVRILQYVGNPRPHNEFMQYALFYGVPGGLLYIASCAGVYIRALRRRARLDSLTLAALTAAFGYLAGSFFGLTVYNTAPYLFIMMGLSYIWEGAPPGGASETQGATGTQNASVADGASGTQGANIADDASHTE